jgi:hypothetical protein
MTLEALKETIAELPENDRCSLAAWLNELNYDDWDREMVADFSPGGRGMALVEQIQREVAEGKSVPFQEGLEAARTARELQQD